MKISGDTDDDALESSYTSSFVRALKRLKREQVEELPWDVLDIICKTLDFEDLFQFSGVCKSWRTFHKSTFLSSQQPLLVHVLIRTRNMQLYSFIDIPNQKVYDLDIMSRFQRHNFVYISFSSQYFIMVHNNTFVLFNPFTRNKKVINATFKVLRGLFAQYGYRALLAFEKFSDEKEFVLLVLCTDSGTLYVYQSRHDSWDTYSTPKAQHIIDFVVLNNIIYVLTDHADIGVLNLNSVNIQFLNLKNTLKYKDVPRSYWLLNCDEQLLMLDVEGREAYKIDLSTMNYVEMKSLGDIALLYVFSRNCHALSNPRRFGYESNHVYEHGLSFGTLDQCDINHWNNYVTVKTLKLPRSSKTSKTRRFDAHIFDWCFRHLKYEVDYS